MWLTLTFPAWVLAVSVLLLIRAGVIDRESERKPQSSATAKPMS
jgi:hypothetical protein